MEHFNISIFMLSHDVYQVYFVHVIIYTLYLVASLLDSVTYLQDSTCTIIIYSVSGCYHYTHPNRVYLMLLKLPPVCEPFPTNSSTFEAMKNKGRHY